MKSKALFLLIVFLLNTLIGFGCALHMNMITESTKENSVHYFDSNHNSHQHKSEKHHIAQKTKSPCALSNPASSLAKEQSCCCQNDANKFSVFAKDIPQTQKVTIHAPVIDLKSPKMRFGPLQSKVFEMQASNNSERRPPTIDIRIAIQSFQI